MMRFIFFDSAGVILFERNDAENASATHEEMSFQALFPYDAGKEIRRGMRVGYEDSLGVFQVFEIRKVRNYEPDHAQEITAEHISISELTDEFCDKAEYDNKTASQALSPLLANTGWAIGNDTASNTSSGDISRGDVWNATRTIQKNWNVYIIPRIVVGASGITNKYLDIMPAGGIWRGFRVSLDKNASQMGVIWDDSKLKTALYAFGKETSGTPVTFKDVVWTTAGGDPANKPANQIYVEDTAATAAYGRNGRPRFGYYQNASISDPEVLLQKTWEVLQTVKLPDVTIDSTITDLYKLGYVDVPIRLHDTALVEVRPTGVILQKEIIQYTEDLLNPQNSRIVVGVYIPNIIYINRQNAKRGGGGGGSGGQTPLEYTTENNTVQISIDSRGLQSLCVGTGAQLNPDGSLVIDPDTGYPVFIDGGENLWSNIQQNKTSITQEVVNRQNADSTLSGRITVEAGKITQIVTAVGSNGEVTAASIVDAVNSAGSRVVIDADHIDLQGVVTADSLATDIAGLGTVITNTLEVNTQLDVSGPAYFDSTISCEDSTGYFGAISADEIYTDSIELNGNTFTNVIVSASVSGNVLTLTPLSGNPITFSKATTLTGGWSSGAYTVTATQNSETVDTNVTSLTNTGHWGSGSGEDPNKYYYATYATINGGATPVATGNTTIIDATARYNAGASSVTISSASRTNESNSALTGDSSIGTAGYKYIVITATASNGATRTIAVNATPTFTAGVTEGEGHFTQATVTLQGASDTVYVEATSGGYDYYRAGTAVNVYPGNGGSFTPQGTAFNKLTRWGNGTLFKLNAQGQYVSQGSHTWYYVDNTNGTQYYNAGSGTRYARGSSYSITPIDAGTKKHLLSTTRFKAGTTDTTTYYTKTS